MSWLKSLVGAALPFGLGAALIGGDSTPAPVTTDPAADAAKAAQQAALAANADAAARKKRVNRDVLASSALGSALGATDTTSALGQAAKTKLGQ